MSIYQVGKDNIQLIWPVPANGGSPILGYHVDMEANGDGSWERIYDGWSLKMLLEKLIEVRISLRS